MNSPKYQIEIEVYARPEAIDNGEGEYALNEAAEIIDFFSDYFNTSYPLAQSSIWHEIFFQNFIYLKKYICNKVQVAVPDFESGAMENWGLIMYREHSLLNTHFSLSIQKDITQIVSHELAHQWVNSFFFLFFFILFSFKKI